jgi:hypothetical protein
VGTSQARETFRAGVDVSLEHDGASVRGEYLAQRSDDLEDDLEID